MHWYHWVLIGVMGFVVIPWVLSLFIAPYIVFTMLLRRTSKEKWARGPAKYLDEIGMKIYESGMAWSRENAQYKRDVHIVNQGLNLYGEYYDFGSDKCVIILPGRREGLFGSYDFAIPYAKSGWNVLMIDPRAHGISDGEFNTVGNVEYSDNMAWANFLATECGIRSVVLHGVCIGSAGGLLAAIHEDCPKVICGLVTDGMFETFAKSTHYHMRKYHVPSIPGMDVWMIDWWMRHFTGYSMRRGPIHLIDQLQLPLLMLNSREDLFSTPDQAQRLYDKAGSARKRLVWFEKGYHSQLRYNDPQLYDTSIHDFLESLTTVSV